MYENFKRVLFLFVFLCIISACTELPVPEKAEVTVEIDYGTKFHSEILTLINSTAFDAFNEIAEIEASWYDMTGDGTKEPMITGVGGVNQTHTKFWIFYVNNSPAPVGVGAYRLRDGDILLLRYESSPF